MKIKEKQITVIEFKNVTKKYFVHHEKPTLSERILNGKNEKFIAINNLSFTVKKGQIVGIIGPNGSGKTTLLKLITGVSTPTTGKITTLGRIVSLIDLEAGFHPELTGLENIYLNGMVLGMTKQDIDYKLKSIIRFAAIGHFIDAPIFTYSSGMLLRLGFSVAIHANPDILLLDENISVGDQNFRKKAILALYKFLSESKTIIIASHDLGFIKQNCKRVLGLKYGKLIADGPVRKIINQYETSI